MGEASTTTAPTAVEGVKADSRHLRGPLSEELVDGSSTFTNDAQTVLKFHGIYAQDNRDVRRERTQKRQELDHICMVRASIPGGVLTADQYLVMDRLADEVANGTLRITSRQGIQYHFTRKGGLKPLISTLNEHLVSTLAACGDVVRNVTCCPAPLAGRPHGQLLDAALDLNRRFKPHTGAYWELWVDGEKAVSAMEPRAPHTAAGSGGTDAEPLYGDTYLPRKFKIGFAYPGDNCVDVYTDDVGLVPKVRKGKVAGFTVVVGGGLGMTHNEPATYPRLATPLCDVKADEMPEVVEAVIAFHRDNGDRTNRKHARLKYVVEEWGIERVKADIERRVGRTLAPPSPLVWDEPDDHLGWHRQPDRTWFLGVPVENGRVVDRDGHDVRSGLREVIARFRPGVRFTPTQDVLLTGIAGPDRAAVEAVLREHGVRLADDLVPVERTADACPALPTCGLALGESERVLPAVVDELKGVLGELGMVDEAIHVRMTGCPNGCARPYTAEIGFVGRTKKNYDVFLGGASVGDRLGRAYAENVPLDQLVTTVRPVLEKWRDARTAGERFGDWCDRASVVTAR